MLKEIHKNIPVVTRLSAQEVKSIALEAGADDAALVSFEHPDLIEEKEYARQALSKVKSVVSFVVRMHPDNIRSPKRSVANLEFHRAGSKVDEVAYNIAVKLSELGYRSINPSMAFPMEMDAFPGRTWIVSQKKVAAAAQLGRMGIHRSIIHPKFGSFILLGAMTGFEDFVEEAVEAKNRHDFRDRVSISQSASMWQSLAYKPNYKAAYCIAVCPAGENILTPFVSDRAQYLNDVMRPLTTKKENVYVVAGSDAEVHVQKRFQEKKVVHVKSSLRAVHAAAFFQAMPLIFQKTPAKGWRGIFHFELIEERVIQATVIIDDGTLSVENGLVGEANVTIKGPGKVWLGVLPRVFQDSFFNIQRG